MIKRVTILCLALVLVLGAVLPCITEVDAAYENTHVNTGNQRADIIAIALTQVGYGEGSGGYTKYGDYHGNAYADWCGYFVSWCARQAGVSTSVLKKQGWAAASKWGLSTFTSSQKTPQPGDLYFRGTAHVGFVYYVSGSNFYTVEGNTVGDKVAIRCLSLSGYTFASPNYAGSNNVNHTHSMQTGYDSSHPHKEYKKCAGCDYKTYTGSTKTLDSCTTCVQANCSHDYSEWKSASSSKHQRTCSKCGKVASAEHGWEDVMVDKEPTCGTDGSKTQRCSACGGTRSVTLKKTNNHSYGEWSSAGASKGHQHTCSVCKKVETVTHNWKDVKTIKEATCKEAGSKEQICSTCGQERTITVPKTNDHQYGQWSYVDGKLHARTCETCGIRSKDYHNVDKESWETDGDSHWHECVDCKEKYEVEAHTYTGSCINPCDVCGHLSAEGHNYGPEMYTNESKHWQKCVDCGEKSLAKNHFFDGECDATCDDCGYIRDAGHKFGETVCDAAAHWQECEVCGEIGGYEKHIAGEEATEEHGQYCTVCDFEIVPVLEHVHTYSYTSSSDSHLGVCGCGHKQGPENHNWDMSTGKCAMCGVNGVKQASSQNWDFVWLILAGAVVTSTVVTTVVMINGIRKRRRYNYDM